MKTLKHFDIVKMPVITEKATNITAANQYTFEVSIDASKPEIKQAIEHIYKVKVKAVNTLINKGKTKIFRGHQGQRSDTKKAYITLDAGQKIDMSTEL
jgi:large subunit ribosomal protein L23